MTPHMRAGQPAPRFGAAIPSSGRSGPAGLARRGRRPTPTPTPLGSDIDMHGPAEARISCAGASPLSTLSLPFHAFLRSPMESNVTSSSFNYKNHCYAEKICSDIHQTIAPGGLSIDRSVFNSRQIVVWFEALSGGKQALLACAPTPTGRPGIADWVGGNACLGLSHCKCILHQHRNTYCRLLFDYSLRHVHTTPYSSISFINRSTTTPFLTRSRIYINIHIYMYTYTRCEIARWIIQLNPQ